MCLAVPGRIIDTYTANGLRMARIDFGGAVREACLEYVPEAKVGDYAIVHVGFAISLLDEAEAQARLDVFRALSELAGQDGAG
ncbi:MAG: HypC/HybG/HupF family hydrogenase formation chaperone [Chloroflexota bacterium]